VLLVKNQNKKINSFIFIQVQFKTASFKMKKYIVLTPFVIVIVGYLLNIYNLKIAIIVLISTLIGGYFGQKIKN
jgi:hypothetical protein